MTPRQFSISLKQQFGETLGRIVVMALTLAVILTGCANSSGGYSPEYRAPVQSGDAETARPEEAATSQANSAEAAKRATSLAPVWLDLEKRLAKVGVAGPEVTALLAELKPVPTQSPMGRKISELYKRQFFPARTGKARAKYYKGVVTPANAELCRQYIAQNADAFARAQERYGVPPAIGAALLFVETRLGKVLGDVPENAFYTLASMAVSTRPEDISEWLPKLKDSSQHLDWIAENMRKRSAWAFNETAALIRHMIRDRIPASRLPGSIYGAVGLCQFMPSNISTYGADGDSDGKVDLFTAPDAIASLSNYLFRHGWKAGINRARQHKVLMSYNHSEVYANTILALADLIRQPAGKTARS